MTKTNLAAIGAALAFAAAVPHLARAADSVAAEQLRLNLYATCFVTEDEGWAVGDLGRIFHTINGGLNWEIQHVGDNKRPFVAIACIDSKTLYAAGQVGQIAKTTDGGATWTMLKTSTDRQLLDISFATESRGMVVGDYGRILRTDDGGATWTPISVPTDAKLPEDVAEVVEPGDIVLYGVHFSDPEHVWIVGEFGVILNSSDGGLTFTSQVSPVETTLFGVHFTDNQKGWAVGMEATLVSTTDGGTTWSKQQVDTPKGFSLSIYDVNVNADSNVGWAVGANGFLLNSMDAGQTWQRAQVPVQMGSVWFRGVSILDDGRGFTVGAGGVVLSTNKKEYKPLKEIF